MPVYNGLTNEWHPTQMLADFLTMHEASGKPYDALAYAFVGDCRFNMGRSLLVMGALMGSDVRLAGPAELHPPKDVVDLAKDIAGRTGARITVTEDPGGGRRRASTSSTPTCGSRWARPRTSGPNGSSCSRPIRSTPALLGKSGNPAVKFMHCLPAFHDTEHHRRPRDHGAHRHDRRPRGDPHVGMDKVNPRDGFRDAR